jgi:hypothetical protein
MSNQLKNKELERLSHFEISLLSMEAILAFNSFGSYGFFIKSSKPASSASHGVISSRFFQVRRITGVLTQIFLAALIKFNQLFSDKEGQR